MPDALWNSFLVWFFVMIISFPVGIAISMILARTRIPFSHGLEFMFWIAFMFPGIASTLGWMMMLQPQIGFFNVLLEALPFIDEGPFNIFSLEGIVFARLMADGIAYKVILFTPAFRNMDQALEEAGRVSGASKFGTLAKVTLPVMASPIVLVFSLQLIRIFQGFETELLLGQRWGFYVYSTLIWQEVQGLNYGGAVVIGSITLLIIGMIFPLQRWVTRRRHYTTITGSFKPGLIDLGRLKWPFFSAITLLLALLTALPILVLVVGSFMSHVGFFNATPTWTFDHWARVFTDDVFFSGTRNTLILAVVAGIGSPLLFSVIAYLIVRSKWRLRSTLDSIIWVSAAFPGILSGLGLLILFLSVPGLTWLYGSLWALVLVVIISGNTTGTNIFKGVLVQLGADLEEASRVSGAGWFTTYFQGRDTGADADDGADRNAQFHIRGKYDVQHRPTCRHRHEDALAHRLGMGFGGRFPDGVGGHCGVGHYGPDNGGGLADAGVREAHWDQAGHARSGRADSAGCGSRRGEGMMTVKGLADGR